MEKSYPLPRPATASPTRANVYQSRSVKLIVLLTIGIILTVLHLQSPGQEKKLVPAGPRERHGAIAEETKVPLEIHIMSKCPDALDCLRDLIVPAMSKTASKVNFTLSYIGRPTDPDDGVECMHGPTECLGNILELCAAYEYPDPKIYLGFALCMSRKYSDIPAHSLVQNCALEHGMSFDQINDCASREDGSFGIKLLRDSVTRSKDVGATRSCTVRLDERVRCVRDGGEWKDCEGGSSVKSLTGDIEHLYGEKN
ncbi:hypothetical protein EJ06DRAFT_499740 [Trichodelitschia bisporula]|uniref:Gamma interferon inducible lysosomal thiol reductase n=1 Tax=Trichodelitschia bisporula TaxID=703511 RepID=A0A6G1HL03_9PEZI|nr:hypothetical protein EJ06DRAFT_499740 [Trichodelitschia bisporula]